MNTPTITFIPNAENPNSGKLRIQGNCSVEELYNHANCPKLVKETLEKHVHWQVRCETPIHRALNLKNQFLSFRAAMAVYGIGDIDKGEEIMLKTGSWHTGSSMVRPTPAHTPLVSSFVRLKMEGGRILKARVALTGIEKRRLTKPETDRLIDQELTNGLIQKYAKNISEQYDGFDDFKGKADYRKSMISVTLERALQEAKHG